MKKNLGPLILVLIFIGITVGAFLLSKNSLNSEARSSMPTSDNLLLENGVQTISINAKGGYFPRNTNARANTPSILKIKTNSTFDCSASIVIPSIGYKNNLPSSGETSINLPPQKPGSSIKGLCSMGMYSFTINFN